MTAALLKKIPDSETLYLDNRAQCAYNAIIAFSKSHDFKHIAEAKSFVDAIFNHLLGRPDGTRATAKAE